MGATNLGSQNISFSYQEQAKARTFNKNAYKVLSPGIYNTISLTRLSDTTVSLNPFLAVFEDPNILVSIRAETTIPITVSLDSNHNFIVARFTSLENINNYMDILALDYSSIMPGDLILGKAIYNVLVLAGFDYSSTNYSNYKNLNLENLYSPFLVTANEPYSNKVKVYPGTSIINGTHVTISGITLSPAFSLPVSSNGRTDILYIDNTGSLGIDQGADVAGAPINVMNDLYLPIAILHFPPLATTISGNCIEYLHPYNFISGNIPKGTSSTFGVVEVDGTTITSVSGLVSIPLATSSTVGEVKPDNITTAINVDGTLTKLVNGFTNKTTDNTLSFNNGTRTLTITPTGATFQIFTNGIIRNKITDTIVIPNTEGQHYIYYDPTTGVLTDLVNPTGAQISVLIQNYCFVAFLYWNATNQVALIVGKEQHGIVMDAMDHSYDHTYFRTRWNSGLGPNNINADASGNLNTSAQFGVDAGIIQDEDLQHSISAVGSTIGFPIYYNSGVNPNLRSVTVSGYSVVNTGSGRLAYNQLTISGTWGITEVVNNDYVLYHVFATNSIINPLISVMGQIDYTSLANAQLGATTEINTLVTSFPAPEFKPIATFIFQTNNTYANAVKARIRSTSTGANFVDWRSVATTPGTVVGSSYTLPAATNSQLGGVIIASGLNVDLLGNLNLNIATPSILGGVKPDGTTITVSASGVISGSNNYTLPIATTSGLGGVIPDGNTITVTSGGILQSTIGGMAPVGTMNMYAGASIPSGWLLCNGQAVSRTTYVSLFTAISTTWGVGDNSTTFNVPDMREACPQGAGTYSAVTGTTHGAITAHDARALGGFADDQEQGHKHDDSLGIGTPVITGSGIAPAVSGSGVQSGVPISDGTNGTPRTGTVTRGKTIGVNYIIKY